MNDNKEKKGQFKKKLKSVQWFSHKRRYYIFKHVLILILLASLFCILLFHHLISEYNIFSFISNFSLNFFFILIPVLLYLIEVRRNFKNEFDDIFTLKNNLVYLRRFIANEISGLKNEKHRDIIIDPSNVNQIVGLLRKFKFHKYAAMFLSHIEMKRLYHIDRIIVDVIKKIKKYDSGKDYESIETNWNFKNAKETIEKLEKEKKTQQLKKLFLDDLTYPLSYYLLKDKTSPAVVHYYYISEVLPNETYQNIINAVQVLLKYNIKSDGKETQVFDANIVKAIELLDSNKQDLIDLGMYFNFNIEKSEAVLIILSEPCGVLKLTIKMDKTFQVNSRYDIRLEKNKKWVKKNMVAHLQKKIEQFNLKLIYEEFWNSP